MTLGLTNATNARDLGGHLTLHGRRVKRGVLFRANALHSLSEPDLEILAGLKLACVIDFRGEDEVLKIGADKLPVPAPRLVGLPVIDPAQNVDLFGVVGAVMRGTADADALRFLHPDSPGGGAQGLMTQLYRDFVSTELSRQAFGQALRLVATADTLPLLFHCTAGKDRTGWLAAVVLSALGVERNVIIADYLRTNELSAAATVAAVTQLLEGRVDDPGVITPMLDARAVYLEAAFAEAHARYGGMDGYLRDGLGADDDLLAQLHANLLE